MVKNENYFRKKENFLRLCLGAQKQGKIGSQKGS
jgi:hypothetical protein